ncbi:hypothetical protein KR009_010973, partial [Drosophila setifemur]
FYKMFLRIFSVTKIVCFAGRRGLNPRTALQPATQCAIRQSAPQRQLSHLSSTRMRWKLNLVKMLSGWRHRYCIWRLRRLLGMGFDEGGFQEGTRQAAAIMIDAVRRADWPCIRNCCTEQGSSEIYGLSRDQGPYGSLVRFQSQHLRHATPVRVVRRWIDGRCYVVVDMLFVGLRNLLDFATTEEQEEVLQRIRTVLSETESEPESVQEQFEPSTCRLVMAELMLTFCKDLGDPQDAPLEPDSSEAGWMVDAYKMQGLKLVSFSPATFKFRVTEFQKPV